MIGRYGINEPVIKGKGTYTIWQKSQAGKLPGIPKNVDVDIFREGVQIDDILLTK